MRSSYLFQIFILVGTFLFVCFFYHRVLFSPNSYLFSNSGDGIKNYYTYAYQINKNESYTNFEGFNFPYGENFLYTDSHPILVSVLRPLSTLFPSIKNYSIGILNTLMLLSFILSAYILFLLLKALKIDHFLSLLGALSITILSPQIFRMQGHYALSYSFIIPLTIYLLFLYLKKDQIKWAIALLICQSVALFIHAYLGIISIALVSCFLIIRSSILLLQKKFKLRQVLILCGSMLLPVVLFLTVKYLTDHHGNRSDNPYGFFEYYADFDTILLPNHAPLKPILFAVLPEFTQSWEGWCYIGIGTILLLPFLLLRFLKSLFILKTDLFFNSLLLSAGVIVLFSFGMPFRLNWHEGLEYFPFLKQFRAIGRFSWVFYFVISLYAIYYLNCLSKKTNQIFYKILIQLSLPLLMMMEGIPYHQEVSHSISQSPNLFIQKTLPLPLQENLRLVQAENYQAIIPLPFYCVGSENYEKESSNSTYLQSILFSYHTGLPLLSNHLSRTSLAENKNSLQLFAPRFYEKNIQKDLSSSLPFLVFLNKSDELTSYEEDLLSNSEKITDSKEIALYSITYESLFKNTSKNEQDNYFSLKLSKKNDFELSDSLSFFYYDSFEAEHSETPFRGKGAKKISKQGSSIIKILPSNEFAKNTSYIASIWLSRLSDNYGQDDLNHLTFQLKEWNQHQEVVQEIKMEAMSSPVIYQNWTLIELPFTSKDTNGTLEFSIFGNHPIPKSILADDFLIYPKDAMVYKNLGVNSDKNTVLFKNNHTIKVGH